jgi:hypothetical protein
MDSGRNLLEARERLQKLLFFYSRLPQILTKGTASAMP